MIAGALGLIAATVPVYQKLGTEFMPPLDEGALALHADHAARHLGDRGAAPAAGAGPHPDALSRRSTSVFGKGRPRGHLHRSGALLDDGDRDPAQAEIRVAQGGDAGIDQWPRWLRPYLAHITPDHITHRRADRARWTARCSIPGVSNAWTMPIKNRIDMLTTGVRTPVGIKIYGADLADDRADRQGDRRRPAATCRARAASSPNASAAATSWTST